VRKTPLPHPSLPYEHDITYIIVIIPGAPYIIDCGAYINIALTRQKKRHHQKKKILIAGAPYIIEAMNRRFDAV